MTINRLLEKYSITIEEARNIRALDSSTYFVKEEDSIGSREEFDEKVEEARKESLWGPVPKSWYAYFESTSQKEYLKAMILYFGLSQEELQILKFNYLEGIDDREIRDDIDLRNAKRRQSCMMDLILELRDTTTPEDFALLSREYRTEIERIQREILEYLTRPIPEQTKGKAV